MRWPVRLVLCVLGLAGAVTEDAHADTDWRERIAVPMRAQVPEERLTQRVAPRFDELPEPRGAEDYEAERHAPIIPEPMVFDLVRGLGARRGELEVNVLALAPLQRSDRRPVLWAPEIEWAVLDGVALEFEVPFEDTHLEAWKVAVQVTLGRDARRRFIHGLQAIGEAFDGVDHHELSLLYVPGYRWNETWSALALVGLRQRFGDDVEDATELLINVSVFADVGPRATLGLELDFETDLGDAEAALLCMPQVHVELTERFLLQAGVGARIESSEVLPEVAARAIFTP